MQSTLKLRRKYWMQGRCLSCSQVTRIRLLLGKHIILQSVTRRGAHTGTRGPKTSIVKKKTWNHPLVTRRPACRADDAYGPRNGHSFSFRQSYYYSLWSQQFREEKHENHNECAVRAILQRDGQAKEEDTRAKMPATIARIQNTTKHGAKCSSAPSCRAYASFSSFAVHLQMTQTRCNGNRFFCHI